MQTEEPRLILEGAGERFVIGERFWEDIVAWAGAQGWICESSTVGNDSCREFSDEDSARLAEALDVIGGNLILQSHTNVSEKFIAQLAEALQTLQRFAESGGFRVYPASRGDA